MSEHSISANERKSLEKLLDEDFSLLKADLSRMADEAKQARKDGIQRELKTRVLQARKLEDKVRGLFRQAEDGGFEVHLNRYDGRKAPSTTDFRIKVPDVDRAVSDAEAEVDAELTIAKNLLSRRQHEARRAMLLATLSTEAVAVMQALPSAEEVMREAMATRQLQLVSGRQEVDDDD